MQEPEVHRASRQEGKKIRRWNLTSMNRNPERTNWNPCPFSMLLTLKTRASYRGRDLSWSWDTPWAWPCCMPVGWFSSSATAHMCCIESVASLPTSHSKWNDSDTLSKLGTASHTREGRSARPLGRMFAHEWRREEDSSVPLALPDSRSSVCSSRSSCF